MVNYNDNNLVPFLDANWFLDKYLSSLPDGPAWNKDPDSVMSTSLATLMPTPARVAQTAAGMIADSFPATTVGLLENWQSSLGLPDACLGDNPTLAQEQAQIVARLSDTGGSSLEYFVDYAQSLGYDISITTFRPPIAGIDIAGSVVALPLQSAFWLQVNADPSASLNTVISCEFEERRRATTTFFYTYGYGVQGDTSVIQASNASTYDVYGNESGSSDNVAALVVDDINGYYVIDDLTGDYVAIPYTVIYWDEGYTWDDGVDVWE